MSCQVNQHQSSIHFSPSLTSTVKISISQSLSVVAPRPLTTNRQGTFRPREWTPWRRPFLMNLQEERSLFHLCSMRGCWTGGTLNEGGAATDTPGFVVTSLMFPQEPELAAFISSWHQDALVLKDLRRRLPVVLYIPAVLGIQLNSQLAQTIPLLHGINCTDFVNFVRRLLWRLVMIQKGFNMFLPSCPAWVQPTRCNLGHWDATRSSGLEGIAAWSPESPQHQSVNANKSLCEQFK